jgi:hypothetical protein|tara:strand:- start:264 stop:464 length:201 start_codon:yes stop_codon:yes gene_type:complete
LRFDPVDRVAISLRALAAVAELRQSLERCLVILKGESAYQFPNRVLLGIRLLVEDAGPNADVNSSN